MIKTSEQQEKGKTQDPVGWDKGTDAGYPTEIAHASTG